MLNTLDRHSVKAIGRIQAFFGYSQRGPCYCLVSFSKTTDLVRASKYDMAQVIGNIAMAASDLIPDRHVCLDADMPTCFCGLGIFPRPLDEDSGYPSIP